MAAVEPELVEVGDLAGVREHPLGTWNGIDVNRPAVLVDDEDLVAVLDQLGGNRAADGTGSGNGDPHQPFSSGAAPSTAIALSANLSRTMTLRRSPS